MQDRRILINAYAKNMMKKIHNDYPGTECELKLVDDREVMVVTLNGDILAVGHDYGDIDATLKVTYKKQ